jgi:phage terminase large subunit
LFLDERIYAPRLLSTEFFTLADEGVRETYAEIFADSEDPRLIEEMAQYVRKDGSTFNVLPVKKEQGSVFAGIREVKRHHLHITRRSANIQREIKFYKWKEDKNGQVQDDPVKLHDHAMDAVRYPVFMRPQRSQFEVVFSA